MIRDPTLKDTRFNMLGYTIIYVIPSRMGIKKLLESGR